MKHTEAILSRLSTQLPQLKKKYPISRLALFGSAARKDFDPKESDIDILVEFNGDIGWEYFDLIWDIEKIFPDSKVDVVPFGAIQPHYWPYIQEDLIYA